MVEFCSKCGSIIMGKKGENVLCPACGTKNKTKDTIKLTEKVAKKEELEVINANKTEEIHPITPADCPQCGCKQAYYWTKQTRAGDEPETQFFKCVECAHKWRDYR